MKSKSIGICAKHFMELKDYMSPAENFIRAMKLEEIKPKNNLNKVLDFGSGEGRHAEYLLNMGYSVFAIDVSEETVNATRNRLKQYNNVEVALMDENAK